MGQDMRFYIEEENRRELDTLRERLRVARSVMREVVVYEMGSLQKARDIWKVGPWKRMVQFIDVNEPTDTSRIPTEEKSNG
jgi:hypothetical protein